jgi:hypothetical protein
MAINFTHLSNLNPPKFTQIVIFGLKISHLAIPDQSHLTIA